MLILIRGIPGSGKTTLAKELLMQGDESSPIVHLEADMYHTDHNGKYSWSPEKTKSAHEWCQTTAKILLNAGYTVIVSNTFTRLWEMQPYIDIATEANKKFEVHRCQGKFHNVHNVPEDVVVKMMERMEDYSGEIVVPVREEV